jgi:mersacidin/lichenicidin family type 2 lantibiotic
MGIKNLIRAWKDPGYRNSLNAAERAALPPHPAGAIELDEDELGHIVGGRPRLPTSAPCRKQRTTPKLRD